MGEIYTDRQGNDKAMSTSRSYRRVNSHGTDLLQIFTVVSSKKKKNKASG